KLALKLINGWHSPHAERRCQARELHDIATQAANDVAKEQQKTVYQQTLAEQISQRELTAIIELGNLFRRRAGGFSQINAFIAGLLNKDTPFDGHCEINLFAYAFLKHAKNYDFFTRFEQQNLTDIQQVIDDLTVKVGLLEDFERLGTALLGEISKLKDPYLKLRAIAARPAARDEQRTLACLLITGPSTAKDIKLDLDLNFSLDQRVMSALVATGTVVELKNCDNELVYSLNTKTLPVVVFLVRETVGLDVIDLLDNIGGTR
ncbi:MAG: hypothetical protein MJK04_00020, partial [Psychrosphaera sp.]|nr:hypothetical protein [Psychrosphaera sp.]